MTTAAADKSYKGTISNFTGTHIDNDGVPYFVFALRVENVNEPIPYEYVFYLNLRHEVAKPIVVTVTQAWARAGRVEVFLEENIEQKMRVADVRCL